MFLSGIFCLKKNKSNHPKPFCYGFFRFFLILDLMSAHQGEMTITITLPQPLESSLQRIISSFLLCKLVIDCLTLVVFDRLRQSKSRTMSNFSSWVA
ncbi:hypothetical protein VP01_416g6 [Puccinia sorghi]|uniref:Uncharacterized protein n=1 Tax=Puccinia sorghi TaxID=27349 RepID=A0A0L6UQX5_9BASI|nr:hypothetical protein VP01_416g6 [Puccinia sorghi]